MIDSSIYGHLWATEASRAVFSEPARLDRWVEVIAALARAQARVGLIPASSADAISDLVASELDVERIAADTRATSHSTLGLIRELQRHLPADAQEHVYMGTTVQDVTDTAAALEMAAIGQLIWQDLRSIEATLLSTATEHRTTPMVGRTHGQPGAPITFGFKVASWLDEIGRSIERLDQARDRCLVAQLGGAVGSLGFFGGNGLALRAAFADEVGLRQPTVSWLSSRDRIAEFGHILALATAALARMANEVFTLQRPEIGELSETTSPSTVGSITMPHKRNPERSEQVVTLARMVRAQASLLTETMVQEHERDARGWKAEWAAFPTLCHHATASTSLSTELVRGLQVSTDAMLTNIAVSGSISSEQLLRRLSDRRGKHTAQAALQDAYGLTHRTGKPLTDALRSVATPDEITASLGVDTGSSAAMVDLVVAEAKKRRRAETDSWR
jgi:adenylosuccinate lyase